MAEETEKIYCPVSDNSALNPMLSALLTNQNGNNQMWNNPFSYVMMMWLFRLMGNNGWGDGTSSGENTNSRAIATLQDTVANNHNNDLVMQALNNNQAAVRELAQTFNTDLGTIQQACCNINASIQQIGGQIGYSAEGVKNAIALGDSSIISKMQECCCSNKLLVQQMGYEGQLRDQTNTAAITSRIDQLANGVTQLGAQLGYQGERNTSSIIQADQQNTQAIITNATANTQRILDQMCSNNTQELRDKLAQLSQDAQTAKIIANLNGTSSNSIW